ncbi:hypothetical protein TTHERM_00048920 (macronuclear) [Tetrahymena thermophila SB210]|uniref:Uncharacterized protein n=1 Tax=Tetrahymena thermophila (strain SB210) TaxID=312017 RepID=Q23D98_TETTS|nr:hypothetical protein TTHERM_00048920 [Tetrahymena thermophila SB210]EAR94457.2 hypothetical protein TTHERM_00048920 [Tetrahymena thermophila SB210]|eukprot:XP_001014788.2 hypothetical protein TTHERM_00048920 [Tetrahymena thermophila SB210]
MIDIINQDQTHPFKRRIQNEVKKYSNINVIMQRLEVQGYLDELFNLLTKIKDCEDKFTISELKKIQSQRNENDQQFDFNEQYNNNCQIFTQNLQLIIQLIVHDVWQKKSQYSIVNSPMRNKSSHKKENFKNSIILSNVPQVNMFNPGSSINLDNNQQITQPNTQRILTQTDMNSSQILTNTSQVFSNNNTNTNASNDKKLQISQLQTSQYLKKSAVIEKDRHTPSFNSKQQIYFQHHQGANLGDSQKVKVNESASSQLNNSSQNIQNQNQSKQLNTQTNLNNLVNSSSQSSLANTKGLQQTQTLTHSSSYQNLSSSKNNLNNSFNNSRQSSLLKPSSSNINQISSSINQSNQYLNTTTNTSQSSNYPQKSYLQSHPPLPHSSSSTSFINNNTNNRGQINQNTISSHLNNSILREDKRNNINTSTIDSARDSIKRQSITNSSILKPHYFSNADYGKCNTQRSLSSYNNSREINQQMQTSRDINSSILSASIQITNDNKSKENYKPLQNTNRLNTYVN